MTKIIDSYQLIPLKELESNKFFVFLKKLLYFRSTISRIKLFNIE